MVTATAREENSEFCVAIGLATRIAGLLTQLVKVPGFKIELGIHQIWVIHWFNPCQLVMHPHFSALFYMYIMICCSWQEVVNHCY